MYKIIITSFVNTHHQIPYVGMLSSYRCVRHVLLIRENVQPMRLLEASLLPTTDHKCDNPSKCFIFRYYT